MGERFKGPPQGWAALRWEVGVVFLGIVLALGAQQIADELYSRGQAEQAKRKIEEELVAHERDAYERLAVQPCLTTHLGNLMAAVRTPGREWKAMPMASNMAGLTKSDRPALRLFPAAYRAPNRLWVEDALDSARASGALDHLPNELVADYIEVYSRGRRIRALQDDEEDGAVRIAALAFDGPIDANTRLELVAALSAIDNANGRIEITAVQDVEMLRAILRDVRAPRRAAEIAQRIQLQRRFRGQCVLPLKLKA